MVKQEKIEERINRVVKGEHQQALIHGDCREVLDYFPEECIDCVITSPPYWKMRNYEVDDEYANTLIGEENNPEEYVNKIANVFEKVKKVLKPEGSVWLNIGDKYCNKNLMGMPWRVALKLQEKRWTLRNDVIWNQMKGTQSVNDRLRMNHEHIFHFTKNKKYYYDSEKMRKDRAKQPTIRDNGEVVSATGVSGKKYRKQIKKSDGLSEEERGEALKALENTLDKMREGEIVDFRMTIRGNQRTLHSNDTEISGRARELKKKGFFIISSPNRGYMPNSIWEIVPEDKWRDDAHYAVFPIELLEGPIKTTCPPENGIVLDPFVGTGSAVIAAVKINRKGIGIDISQKYLEIARDRLKDIQLTSPSHQEARLIQVSEHTL